MRKELLLTAILTSLLLGGLWAVEAAPPAINHVNDGVGIGHKIPLLVFGENLYSGGGRPAGNVFRVIGLPAATAEEVRAWAKELNRPLPALPQKPPEGANSRGIVFPEYPNVGVLEEVYFAQQCLIWAVNADGVSAPYQTNKPQPWWLSEELAEPGEEVMLFGRDVAPQWGKSYIILYPQKGGEPLLPEPRNARNDWPHTIVFRLDVNMPPGKYDVWVHTGQGGRWGFAGPLELNIVAPPAAPPVVSARDHGARGDGTSDDTAALKAALAAAPKGGIVSLAPGTYNITETLILPEGVTLRGSSLANTVIRGVGYDPRGPRRSWASQLAAAAAAVRLVSKSVLTDVSLEGSLANGWGGEGLVEINSGPNVEFTDGAVLNNVSVRPGSYEGSKLYRSAVSAGNTKNTRIIGCDIEGSIGFGSITWKAHVLKNRATTIGSRSFNECWIAENKLSDADKGLVLVLEPWGSRRNYIHWNEINDVQGWERNTDGETYLFHGETEGTRWGRTLSRVVSATSDSLTDMRVSWKPGIQTNSTVLIVSGRGMGQYRQVVGNDEHTLNLETPWRTVPDETSRYAVFKGFVENIMQNNSQRSRGAAQLWYDSIGNLISGHRTYGEPTTIYALGGHLWDGKDSDVKRAWAFCPSWFNRITGCTVDRTAIYSGGEGPGNNAYQEPPAMGNIIANNKLHGLAASNYSGGRSLMTAALAVTAGCRTAGAPLTTTLSSAFTLFCNNDVSDSPVGIRLDPGTEFTWVKENRFVGVQTPIVDNGSSSQIYGNLGLSLLEKEGTRLEDKAYIASPLPRPALPASGPLPQSSQAGRASEMARLQADYRQAYLDVSLPESLFIVTEDVTVTKRCAANLQVLFEMLKEYDKKHGKLPAARFWPDKALVDQDSLVKLLGPAAGPFLVCPAFDNDMAAMGLGYVWNEKLSGVKLAGIKDPGNVWMLMDAIGTHPWTGYVERIGHWKQGKRGINVLYADGSVKWETPVRDEKWWNGWMQAG